MECLVVGISALLMQAIDFITLLHDDDLLKTNFADWANKLYQQYVSGTCFSIAGSILKFMISEQSKRNIKNHP